MANPFLIRISVRPYIRKYLLYHYSEPIFVSDRGYAPAFVENTLEKPLKVAPGKLEKKDKVSYGAFVGFEVNAATVRKRGNMISSDNVKKFDQVIADLIHEEMYKFVAAIKSYGGQVDDGIRSFQDMYGFTEDELPFENLKRWYYRERQRLEARKQQRQTEPAQFTLNFFEERGAIPHMIDNALGAQMSLLAMSH